jgi:hypothetical protein
MFVPVVIPRPFAFLPLGTVDSHCLGSRTHALPTLVGSWTRRNRTNQSVFRSAHTYLHSLTTVHQQHKFDYTSRLFYVRSNDQLSLDNQGSGLHRCHAKSFWTPSMEISPHTTPTQGPSGPSMAQVLNQVMDVW